MTGTEKTGQGSGRLSILAIVISFVAVLISFLSPYYNILKPFELDVRVDPKIGLHHRDNFGLYVNVDVHNRSPRAGLITDICLVLYGSNSPQDKYLFEIKDFRVLLEDEITYTSSEEKLPLLVEPRQRMNKMVRFVYDSDEEFPISMGTYICEVLLWISDNQKADYVEEFQFKITKDVLDKYIELREKKSTNLQWLSVIGHTPLESKKLTTGEYKLLH